MTAWSLSEELAARETKQLRSFCGNTYHRPPCVLHISQPYWLLEIEQHQAISRNLMTVISTLHACVYAASYFHGPQLVCECCGVRLRCCIQFSTYICCWSVFHLFFHCLWVFWASHRLHVYIHECLLCHASDFLSMNGAFSYVSCDTIMAPSQVAVHCTLITYTTIYHIASVSILDTSDDHAMHRLLAHHLLLHFYNVSTHYYANFNFAIAFIHTLGPAGYKPTHMQ